MGITTRIIKSVQGISSSVTEISQAYTNLILPTLESKRIADARLVICLTCENYGVQPEFKYKCCLLCNCPIKGVINASSITKCKANKWHE